MKIHIYERIIIRRILLHTRVEVPSMQILRVKRVHVASTDDRKNLTSLIRQSIVRSVFCMVENVYERVLSLTETRMQQHKRIYYQIKEFSRNALIKIAVCGGRACCIVFHVSRV